MKKIITILATAVLLQPAFAQSEAGANYVKAIEKAVADSKDPKKASKTATWLKLADAYIKAYQAPMGSTVWDINTSRQIITLEKQPLSSSQETVGSISYDVDVYAHSKYYYKNGLLAMIKVTAPFVENALDRALEAYEQAAATDPEGKKSKDICTGIRVLNKYYCQDASNDYYFGQFASSSANFEKAAKALATAPLSLVDTTSIYNAGLTAAMTRDLARAKVFFEKCIEIGHYEEGDVYAKLADCYKAEGNDEAFKSTLEKGFEMFPSSQGIMIGLINHYIEAKENPDKLITLIEAAIKNEPNNASLYYVKGNIYKQLDKMDEAIAAYDECLKANPAYEYGEIGKGLLYKDKAEKIAEAAQNEFDDKKYEALVAEFDVNFLAAGEHFRKAYEISADSEIKANLADFIKGIYYRYKDKDPKYNEIFEKFDAIVKSNSAAK